MQKAKEVIIIERIYKSGKELFTVYTAESVGVNRELRGSIVPKSQLKRKFPQIVDWILAKHGRAAQRAAAARSARERNASRQIVRGSIALHKAEKEHKED